METLNQLTSFAPYHRVNEWASQCSRLSLCAHTRYATDSDLTVIIASRLRSVFGSLHVFFNSIPALEIDRVVPWVEAKGEAE